jgi:heme exporter protein A
MTHHYSNCGTLTVKDLSVSRSNTVLISGLSFQLDAGELIWMTGSNGIGKTSLLKCIAGTLAPTHGEILWNTKDIKQSDTSPIGYQGHDDAHKKDLSVTENLDFWHTLYRSSGSVRGALNMVGLNKQTNLPARGLSAGQSRRLSLARLWLKDAPLWILDEPGAAMDVHGRALIKHMVEQHLSKKGCVILASHSAPSAIGQNPRLMTLNRDQHADT